MQRLPIGDAPVELRTRPRPIAAAPSSRGAIETAASFALEKIGRAAGKTWAVGNEHGYAPSG